MRHRPFIVFRCLPPSFTVLPLPFCCLSNAFFLSFHCPFTAFRRGSARRHRYFRTQDEGKRPTILDEFCNHVSATLFSRRFMALFVGLYRRGGLQRYGPVPADLRGGGLPRAPGGCQVVRNHPRGWVGGEDRELSRGEERRGGGEWRTVLCRSRSALAESIGHS